MKLYHGSTVEITEIDFSKSKPNKDFGRGFYLSADKAQAEKLAEYKSFQFGGKPILNAFEFDEKALSDDSLKVLKFDGYSKEWANLYSPTATLKMAKAYTTTTLLLGLLPTIVSVCKCADTSSVRYL